MVSDTSFDSVRTHQRNKENYSKNKNKLQTQETKTRKNNLDKFNPESN